MQSTYKNAFIQIINFLDNLERNNGLSYYLVGGILVNIYSDFRITRDIDVVVDLELANLRISDYLSLLKQNEFHPFQDWNTALILAKQTNIIQFLDRSDTIRYDNHIIIRSSGNKYKKIGPLGLNRRVREKIFGIECWITSKEDFILSKLVYGGWQDYSDALGCWLRFYEELDKNYLEKISKELGLKQEYALLESGIDDPDEFFEALKNH